VLEVGPGAVEGTDEVHVEHVPERLRVEVADGQDRLEHAGVGDPQVDRPELVHDGIEEPADSFAVPHVHRLADVTDVGPVAGTRADASAGRGERPGQTLAQPATGPGDDDCEVRIHDR
jgi:hypothetical protein